ncbi:hypothetical protein ILUMI_05973 [Ignelater luminosus]|uniref:Uncharacterized protein n=1 Tax=Ignelater luminosus TaxID=2038154 RepID=A0A8K0DAX9_IGNLU|nr:hypothetical protein ILUMI_05973 [Ignelater luminosus]
MIKVTGYYWRDYDANDIPKDAILGGTDGKGNTYVGQTAHPYGGFLPGEISAVDKIMYYVLDSKVYSTSLDVKILCSQQPEKLQWIPAKGNDKFSDFKNKNFILGGHIDNDTQLIGRIKLENGVLAVGRIETSNDVFSIIDVRTTSSAGPYEVLVSNINDSENKI